MLAHLGDPLSVLALGPGSETEVAGVRRGLISLARERHGDAVADRLSFSTNGPWGVLQAANAPAELGLAADEGLAWLWVAASQGDPQAIHDIIATREADVIRADSARAAIVQKGLDGWRRFVSLRSEMKAMPSEVVEEPNYLDEVRDPDNLAAAVEPDGLVVLSEIGDPSSKEGADIMRRFGQMLKRPVEWRGELPEAGVIEREILARWPWATVVANKIEGRLAVLRSGGAGRIKLSPLLFYGPPGSGKTSLARWLGERLGLHNAVIPCGGVIDSAGFAPVSRGWNASRPGAVAIHMLSHRTCNPLLVLDELDKTSKVGSQNGSLMAVLLSVVNARDYYDTYFLSKLDISGVSFIGTANEISMIDPTLLERFTPVRVDAPGPEHFDHLMTACREDFILDNGLDPMRVPEIDGVEREVLRDAFVSGPKSARAFRLRYDRMAEILMSEMELAPHQGLLH